MPPKKQNKKSAKPNQNMVQQPGRPIQQEKAATQKIVRRCYWRRKNLSQPLAPAGNDEALVCGVAAETKYCNGSISFSLSDYFDLLNPGKNFLDTNDSYRIENVDVYMEISNLNFSDFFRRFNVWYKADFDDNNVIDWKVLQTRDCVHMKTLNPTTNSVRIKLMSIKPSADYRNSSTGSGPENAIPGTGTWYDVAAPFQNFVGIKYHVEVNSGTGESTIPRVSFPDCAHFAFRGQI